MKISLKFLSKILSDAINKERKKIHPDGHSVYELEADVTIPSEYIIFMHFLGEVNVQIQNKIKKYILRNQNIDGGWSLFFGGKSDVSATVKAYFALKLSGCDMNDNKMIKARKVIFEHGGAENSNVFTRITLALFGEISWKTIPAMPIEIMKLPEWSPFHLNKISYWSRTVLVPLLIILNKKPLANNPKGVSIKEIFKDKYVAKLNIQGQKNFWSIIFNFIDKVVRKIEPVLPKKNKLLCTKKAYEWILIRLNGKDGLGGIFPAMVNSLIALSISEEKAKYKKECKIVRDAIDKLLVERNDEAYCQPCVSPIWDTGWIGHALIENEINIDKSIDWLLKKEIKSKGDWAEIKSNLEPGGWAFQYNNKFYPDVDDTALVGMLLDRYNRGKDNVTISNSIERTRKWIIGMQSKNGGWGSFDADNNHSYLNYIPFADHGALLDPPTVDVTARCLSFLAQLNKKEDKKVMNRALKYIISEQEKDGSWFGRWGTNYIYGTWSVLSSINLIEFEQKDYIQQKAIKYIKGNQRLDGGWGEDGETYFSKNLNSTKTSTPSQTAWAVLGLISAGELNSNEVSHGINYLIENYSENNWDEKFYTAVGFPKVFYLKYHGYSRYFPILAISKYLSLKNSNSLKPLHGV